MIDWVKNCRQNIRMPQLELSLRRPANQNDLFIAKINKVFDHHLSASDVVINPRKPCWVRLFQDAI